MVIPSLPSRSELLQRAVESVQNQAIPPWITVSTHVYLDEEKQGAWTARNKAIDLALADKPDWLLFLDDDDELHINAITTLVCAAKEYDADIAWGWYEVVGGDDPFPMHRGRQLDIDDPHCIPIVYLSKASIFAHSHKELGGAFQANQHELPSWFEQDWPILHHMVTSGAKTKAISESIWSWHHHGGNTSGMPD